MYLEAVWTAYLEAIWTVYLEVYIINDNIICMMIHNKVQILGSIWAENLGKRNHRPQEAFNPLLGLWNPVLFNKA